MFCSAGRRYLRWFLLFSVSFAAGKDCSFPSPLLDLNEANSQLQGCTNVTTDLVIGDPACSGESALPWLLGEATTRSVQEIVGSLIIQCCNGLSNVSGWSALQTIRGSLIIEANMDLQSVVSAFAALNRLDGSLIIRQNGALTSVVTSFLALDRIGGYINIERNQNLSDLSGLGTLSVIEGKQLLVGSALSVLFNPALEDLAWLASMDSIENGVVHIEGNTALCYAGYPQWGTFGSFFNRSGVLGEDKGIDWRSLISSTAEWEYSWTGTSIPSLVVKGNAPSGSCASATCHSDCPAGAGCFGPRLLSLCGSCQPLAAGGDTCQFNTSQECPGVLIVIGEVEMEAAASSHEGETSSHEGEGVGCSQFEYECLPSDRGCPDGQSVPSPNNCPRSVCFGGGIPYCNVSVGQERRTDDCFQCYPPFKVMVPLHFQEEIEKEAVEKVKKIGGHFEKNCFEHKVCLTESQREECIEEFLRIQSEILKEEIAEEKNSRKAKDLALKTALPIVCGLVIIVFVSLSVFAHYRYPHVSPSGEKRHRKKKEEDENVAAGNQTWRPRPTIRYR